MDLVAEEDDKIRLRRVQLRLEQRDRLLLRLVDILRIGHDEDAELPVFVKLQLPIACAARAAGTRETSSTVHSASAASILNFFKADRLFIYRLKSIVADSSPARNRAAGTQKSRRRPGGSFVCFKNRLRA